ncbi:aminotransferase class I/II-fold pyridoxal phosphate-dependent enzyme [Bizionia paragorgiae]|jgi:pyridoxal phosphate-dependent aminotransferase EpsN|uniref:DegT/DnrJ/EryC1/StrS family aminotransferase n=1 Tax=Bizionia paragorgiae TaxID=283786 RepID=UPI00299DC00F|nr:aminotransferase class I/II-fold pyridoxal phosphate-dependent enzyme [Bizionia paragorgiae]MDX1271104.1 aminotransferase class I/II-fold pyridoxal phosphate-dependent enzyme [Bizionia paragorgiae]
MNPKIWLSAPHLGTSEEDFVKQVFADNWVAPVGPQLLEFESAINNYLDASTFTTALSSGTAAIHLALLLLEVAIGDEVLCQSFTFSATANPITYLGATPVFIDSEPETWNMCPVILEEAIKDRIHKNKKPKAIIFVNLYGMPAKIDAILKVAETYGIPVIEDAAEALGSNYKSRRCGTFGHFSVFSFNGNKIITTSGGGALISRTKAHHERALFYATQAKENALHYEHKHIGYNYRLSNVCAAIGLGQMEVLSNRIAKRQENHQFYKEFFKDNATINVFEAPDHNYQSNYWLSCILIEPTAQFSVSDLVNYLAECHIEARPLWKPLHLQPVFKPYPYYGGTICEKLFNNGVCLPSGSNLTDGDRLRIAAVLTDFLKNN